MQRSRWYTMEPPPEAKTKPDPVKPEPATPPRAPSTPAPVPTSNRPTSPGRAFRPPIPETVVIPHAEIHEPPIGTNTRIRVAIAQGFCRNIGHAKRLAIEEWLKKRGL